MIRWCIIYYQGLNSGTWHLTRSPFLIHIGPSIEPMDWHLSRVWVIMDPFFFILPSASGQPSPATLHRCSLLALTLFLFSAVDGNQIEGGERGGVDPWLGGGKRCCCERKREKRRRERRIWFALSRDALTVFYMTVSYWLYLWSCMRDIN